MGHSQPEHTMTAYRGNANPELRAAHRRRLNLAGAVAVAVLAALWWVAGPAGASSESSTAVQVCANDNGPLRLATECRGNEQPLALVTDAELAAALAGLDDRLQELEDDQAAQAAEIETLQDTVADLEGDVQALEGRVAGLEDEVQTLQGTVAGLEGDVDSLEESVAALEGRVDDLEELLADPEEVPLARVEALEDLLEGVTRGPDPAERDTLTFSGMNVQIVNGTGQTAGQNGVGNLIVGYNEPPNPNEAERTGSHNVVVGPQNNWTFNSGLVVGIRNQILAPFTSVTGGDSNVADNFGASVSGGQNNRAAGGNSSILGGLNRVVTGNLECFPACS